ncbi:MAG TPA: hypothetical protein VEJ84_08200, partial [Acidimicrobiales bacterium]|nr:hypothetical protein [Acidimicrobiales bacterium]
TGAVKIMRDVDDGGSTGPSVNDRSADDRSADDPSADDRSADDPSADDPSADDPSVGARRAPGWTTGAPRVVTNLLIWGGSVLLAVSAGVHFHLWDSEGYRNIPTIGPLFLLQAIVGFVLAVATAIFRKLALVAASTILAISSIGGLLISIWWGLFGWQESFTAPYVGVALWVESAAAVLLGAASVLLGLTWLAKMRPQGTGRD